MIWVHTLTAEASESMEKLRNLRAQARWPELLKEAQKLQSRLEKSIQAAEKPESEAASAESVPSELRWANFFAFLAQRQLGNFDLALKELQKLNRKDDSLRELALLEMGHLWIAQKNWSAAKKILLELQDQQPNLRMSVQARLGLAQAHLKLGEDKMALALLQKLERQQRRQEMHPEILWLLAQSQKNLKSQVAFCQSLRKLYSQYPSFSEIQPWSLDLSRDLFLGQPTRCATSFEDRRSRIRNLQWAGLSEKARQELAILKTQVPKEEVFEMDRLQIHFLLHEGEVAEALEILRKYRDTHFQSPVFQSLFGLVAARLGDFQAAIGAYAKSHELAPRSKAARQNLFQSAFLSYQSRDYDGATRRFFDFVRTHPRSGLSRDAQWHLAWMSYLKGDFTSALKEFRVLLNKSPRKSANSDRIRYWTAMSHFRLQQYESARQSFQALVKSSPHSYYALASRARLQSMAPLMANLNGKWANKDSGKETSSLEEKGLGKFPGIEVLRSSLEEDGSLASEEAESEEALQSAVNSELAEGVESTTPGDSENLEAGSDAGPVVASRENETSESKSSFANPVLVRRFERARELMILGEPDWAKWELYEIERKTSNPQYLRTLMLEYEKVENFHRSSAIASNTFAGQRNQHGIDGIRYLWEIAFPRAYASYVGQASQRWGVPTELIWGIMRAESSYRKDAISPVGALGLMQVMPMTGLRVAQLMGDSKFEARQLLTPEKAIETGAFYLQRLSKNFAAHSSLIAAAYNAGPHRVKSWLASFGFLDQDEFIEHIPFIETRNYVKRVLANMGIYAHLYSKNTQGFSNLAEPLRVKIDANQVPTRESWD